MTDYTLLEQSLLAITDGVPYETANLANAAALLWQSLPQINWAGFYKLYTDRLVLGPFQGKPACIEIPVGRGVCGSALQSRCTLNVPDVHTFPGHIACDGASRSEIVIPLFSGETVWGVLDIDSPIPNRFSQKDQTGLEKFSAALSRCLSNLSRNSI